MFAIALITFVCSFLFVLMSRRWFVRHADSYAVGKPQRFHVGHVPRVGGLGMFLSWWVGLSCAFVAPYVGWNLGLVIDLRTYIGLTVVVSVSVFAGLIEDLTQQVSVRWRLALTAVSGILAVHLFDVSVLSLGLPVVDDWWTYSGLPGVMLAVIAIMGLTHAFNIIDGYNGLAGAVAVLVGLALIHVSLQVGDRQLALLIVCLTACTVGFLIWNYPRGLIFAGDSGAYLWGVIFSVVSIMLVQRHHNVSPWFPLLLFIYPVWETLFSIYRKLQRGDSPGMADALHLHQLIFRRLIKKYLKNEESADLLKLNNRTAPYLISLTLLSWIPAILFWNNTPILVLFLVIFIVIYVGLYRAIIDFKIPKWLKR